MLTHDGMYRVAPEYQEASHPHHEAVEPWG